MITGLSTMWGRQTPTHFAPKLLLCRQRRRSGFGARRYDRQARSNIHQLKRKCVLLRVLEKRKSLETFKLQDFSLVRTTGLEPVTSCV